MCVPGGTQSTYAGKKRREASLDRLRDRSPSDRWKSLQKMWRPFADDESAPRAPVAGSAEPEVPADGEQQPVDPQPVSLQSDAEGDADGSTVSEAGGEATASSRGADSQENPAPKFTRTAAPARLSVPQSPPAALQAPGGTASAEAAIGAAAAASPVWVIDTDAHPGATEQKRPSAATVMTSLQDEDRPLSPSEAMERRMAEAATLKPITEILPYHDYIPSGTTEPGDELCLDGGDGMNCPKLAELPEVGFEERMFAETYVAWEATNLFSNPLYFEDIPLERYGHTHGCLQPIISLGKFSAQLVGLPYQMALHPVHERRYALGFYRPGEWAPKKYYLPPWNTKAALTAGAAYTGLFFLIP